MDHDLRETEISEGVEDELPPGEQVARLMEDVRELVRTEISYYRSRIDYSRHVVKWSVRFGMLAAFAFGAAGIALVLGLVITLAPHVGPGTATFIVTGSFLLIGAVSAFFARQWIRRIYFPENDGDSDEP